MKDYQKCYKMYCQAKGEINEIPLPYNDWYCLEKQAEEEWDEQGKRSSGRSITTREL